MNISIGNDHAGVDYKNYIIKNLEEKAQHDLIDVALFEDLPNKDFIVNHLETN